MRVALSRNSTRSSRRNSTRTSNNFRIFSNTRRGVDKTRRRKPNNRLTSIRSNTMALDHEEHRNLIASGLSTIVERLDQIVGNSTWRSTATDRTTLKALIRAQALLVHPTDVAAFETAIRNIDTQYSIGILDDTDVAAMNDLQTSRAQFEEDDQTLITHKFGGTR